MNTNLDEQLESAYQNHTNNERVLALYAASFGMGREDMNALTGKRIKLIGGGVSPVLTQLEENKIYPKSVINIHPFPLTQIH